MRLYFKFLTVALTSLNLMATSDNAKELELTDMQQSSSSKTVSQSLTEEEEAMNRLPQEIRDVFECVKKAGPKPFIIKFRDGVNQLLSNDSIDYVSSLYSNACKTVPEWALWTSAGFFVDSCTLGFFCNSHLSALFVSGALCYSASLVSQLFGSNNAKEETRNTLLAYCFNKMLGK